MVPVVVILPGRNRPTEQLLTPLPEHGSVRGVHRPVSHRPGPIEEVNMGVHRRRQRGDLGLWVAVLIVGILMGSIMIAPVGAHLKSFNHLKTKHFYTKKASDERFVNIGEAAADADKLDTLDATAFQHKCKDGAFLAYAHVNASGTFSSTYTTDPTAVQNAYNCKSSTNEVKVRRYSTGVYAVSLPGISNDPANTGEFVVVTGNLGSCQGPGCTDGATNWISLPDGAEGDILFFFIHDYQPQDDMADYGQAEDSPFSFAVLDYS